MKVYHQLVYDDAVEGTTPVYTSPKWNELLASTEVIVIAVYATQVSGTNPTLSVRSQVSGDERNWFPVQANPEINAQVLSLSGQTSLSARSAATDPISGFRRFEITLGGTSPKTRLRIFATGRQIVPAVVPDFGQANRVGSTQTGVTANVNLDFDNAPLVRGITFSAPAWILNPGKIYLLRGQGRFNNFSDSAAGRLLIKWVDDSNTTVGLMDPAAECMPMTRTDAVSQNQVVEVFYSVPPDATGTQRTVKLRCTGSTGSADMLAGSSGWTNSVLEIPSG